MLLSFCKPYLDVEHRDAKITSYPVTVEITDFSRFCDAVKYQHVFCTLKDGYRKGDNWMSSDVVVLDFDHGLTMDAFIEQVNKLNVKCWIASSKSYATEGGYHAYFMLSKKYTNFEEYHNIQKALVNHFTECDKAVSDGSRFLFATPADRCEDCSNNACFADELDFIKQVLVAPVLLDTVQESGFKTTTLPDGQQIITPSVANEQAYTNMQKKRAGRPKKSDRMTKEEVRTVLSYISADCDYNTWVTVGMGLSDAGYGDLFHEWSAESTMYNADECEAKLASFHKDHENGSITMGSVVQLAKLHGYRAGKAAKEYINNKSSEDVDTTLFKSVKDLIPEHYTFSEAMDILANLIRTKIVYIKEYDQFFVATDKRWQEVTNELVSIHASYFEALSAVIQDMFNKNQDIKQATTYLKMIFNKPFSAIKAELQERLGASVSEFDRVPNVLNCCGVVYDLSGDKIVTHPFTYEDKLLKYIPTLPSTDPTQKQVWYDFLKQILDDDDVILEQQKLFGMGFANTTAVRPMIIANGTGGNGKSTQINVMSRALGKSDSYSACRAISSKFLLESNKDASLGANMKGSNLNIYNEMPFGSLCIDIIKGITSCDEFTTRQLYQKAVKFNPYQANVASTNKLPSVKDIDVAILDRLRIFDYPHSFRGKQGVKANLENDLYEQCAGAVVQWVFDGAMLAKQDIAKFGVIPMATKTKKLMDTYEEENSWQLQLFNELGIKQVKGGKIERDELYEKYKETCELVFNTKALGLIPFVKGIKAKFNGVGLYKEQKGHGGCDGQITYFTGIAYTTTPTGTDGDSSKSDNAPKAKSVNSCQNDFATAESMTKAEVHNDVYNSYPKDVVEDFGITTTPAPATDTVTVEQIKELNHQLDTPAPAPATQTKTPSKAFWTVNNQDVKDSPSDTIEEHKEESLVTLQSFDMYADDLPFDKGIQDMPVLDTASNEGNEVDSDMDNDPYDEVIQAVDPEWDALQVKQQEQQEQQEQDPWLKYADDPNYNPCRHADAVIEEELQKPLSDEAIARFLPNRYEKLHSNSSIQDVVNVVCEEFDGHIVKHEGKTTAKYTNKTLATQLATTTPAKKAKALKVVKAREQNDFMGMVANG